jgi:hypothetical protein
VLAGGGAAAAKAGSAEQAGKAYGPEVVGRRLSVWWPEDEVFYSGRVEGFSAADGKHKVLYDDGEPEELVLSTQKFRWEEDEGPAEARAPLKAAEESDGAGGGEEAKGPPSVKRRRIDIQGEDESEEEEFDFKSPPPSLEVDGEGGSASGGKRRGQGEGEAAAGKRSRCGGGDDGSRLRTHPCPYGIFTRGLSLVSKRGRSLPTRRPWSYLITAPLRLSRPPHRVDETPSTRPSLKSTREAFSSACSSLGSAPTPAAHLFSPVTPATVGSGAGSSSRKGGGGAKRKASPAAEGDDDIAAVAARNELPEGVLECGRWVGGVGVCVLVWVSAQP